MGEREILGKDPADIRRDIADTRNAIGEKLVALESQVKETATDTFETVKETALETYEDVKKNFSLQHQVRERPWAMFGGAIGVGFIVGNLLSHKLFDHDEHDLAPREASWAPALASRSNGHNGHTNGNGHPKAAISPGGLLTHSAIVSGLTGLLGQTFAPELRKARGVAIGTVLGIVREIARDAVPTSIADKTVKVIDDVTRSLGGEPAGQKRQVAVAP